MKTKTKNIMKLIKATGRTFYGDETIAKAAPQDTGEIKFFTLGRYVSDDELEKEYNDRGLIPASILSLCEYDKDHRDLLDEKKYVGTHWKDSNGKWCFATFRLWRGDERSVSVYRHADGWTDVWWFAGLRKSSDTKKLNSKPSVALALEKRVESLESDMEKIKKIIKI